MRAFYIDNDIQQNSYYVKIENINVTEDLKSIKMINASTTKELLDKIMEVYSFNENNKLELWSAPMGYTSRIRLDTLTIIPKEYENIWVRGIENNSTL
jgi:hypothetical protein